MNNEKKLTTEAHRRANRNYKRKIARLYIELYLSDQDIIDHLDAQPKKQTYIKDLIRKDMEKGDHS